MNHSIAVAIHINPRLRTSLLVAAVVTLSTMRAFAQAGGGGGFSSTDLKTGIVSFLPSPDGEWIAFTRRSAAGRSIGIIKPDGSSEKSLTSGPGDEGPSWAASSRELIFQRSEGTGSSGLWPSAFTTSVLTEPRTGGAGI